MKLIGNSLVFLDNFLYYILAVKKILGAMEDGLAKVINIAQFKSYVQLTSFQTLKIPHLRILLGNEMSKFHKGCFCSLPPA